MRHVALTLLAYAGLVLADTEILNFSSDFKTLPDITFPFAGYERLLIGNRPK
jgi:hypothetical protein